MLLESNEQLDYTQAIALNESAAYLISETGEQEFTPEDWTKLLTQHYGISHQVAQQDVAKLIDSLREIGLLA